MKNNKLLMIMIVMLVAIALVGAIAVTIILKTSNEGKEKEPSIEEIIEASVDVPELTTNLASNDFIRISFKIQTDGKKAKEELEQRDFQVKNIIIQELSEKKSEELKSKEGKIQLENTLKEKIDSLMQEGHVVKVYITQSLLQ
ncbi:flagellar basal body-associated protein FliL [Bacillus sp. CGMCC 1.16607]|uniref:flagellar basal body-associated protein FliL n=1 Tax=Bacillus sp. CGMCC 1.16607 TaxID=3351842 RepID=UPI003638DBAF